jgi:2-amino-4-hydroxy-6-hydroxymethyldihydropteridine diphosphokinase
MNTAIIMLGSNSNADINLELAKDQLSSYFDVVKESSTTTSKPFGENYHADFWNKALKILSVETKEETIYIFKNIEAEMGRTADSKKSGIIPIDIDLIFWNDNQVHSDYDRFDFVRKCINEIR